MKGKTKSGFKYSIPKKRLDNYNLLEAIGQLEENPLMVSKVLLLLLGEKQTNDLKKHLEDDEGFVSMEKMTEEIKDILSSGDVKNS